MYGDVIGIDDIRKSFLKAANVDNLVAVGKLLVLGVGCRHNLFHCIMQETQDVKWMCH
jgi:hypothetical protein